MHTYIVTFYRGDNEVGTSFGLSADAAAREAYDHVLGTYGHVAHIIRHGTVSGIYIARHDDDVRPDKHNGPRRDENPRTKAELIDYAIERLQDDQEWR